MAFGEIYGSSWWGSVCTETNGFGNIYFVDAGCGAPATTYILAENGDFVITEISDNIIQQ